MFPSLHWESTNDKFSVFGAIPYLLLNLCCTQKGFSSIQKYICTRLTSPKNYIGSNSISIYHCYDRMRNLSASHNYERLVINCNVTVGEDKHSNLEVRGRG